MKHRLHVVQLQLACVVLPQCLELPRGDAVGFDAVLFGEIGAHVANEITRYGWR